MAEIADKRKALSTTTAAAKLRHFGMTASVILTGS
jgi:hypothetical protein